MLVLLRRPETSSLDTGRTWEPLSRTRKRCGLNNARSSSLLNLKCVFFDCVISEDILVLAVGDGRWNKSTVCVCISGLINLAPKWKLRRREQWRCPHHDGLGLSFPVWAPFIVSFISHSTHTHMKRLTRVVYSKGDGGEAPGDKRVQPPWRNKSVHSLIATLIHTLHLR